MLKTVASLGKGNPMASREHKAPTTCQALSTQSGDKYVMTTRANGTHRGPGSHHSTKQTQNGGNSDMGQCC